MDEVNRRPVLPSAAQRRDPPLTQVENMSLNAGFCLCQAFMRTEISPVPFLGRYGSRLRSLIELWLHSKLTDLSTNTHHPPQFVDVGGSNFDRTQMKAINPFFSNIRLQGRHRF